MNQQTRLACTTNLDPLLVMDSQSMSMRQIMLWYTRMWKCTTGDFDVGTEGEPPNYQPVPGQPVEENPSVEPPLQPSQLLKPLAPLPRRRITTQQLESNVRARRSSSSVPPVPSSKAALAFSARSVEPSCVSKKQRRNVGVEVSYRVTAEMFENPGNDWLRLLHSGLVLVSR